ncbi:hypothetical protein NJ7G_1067 [Natrinema sp. J7-2]|nr:hypothetical protein NJ7G_1067 [Natrinema sp. J7-2]
MYGRGRVSACRSASTGRSDRYSSSWSHLLTALLRRESEGRVLLSWQQGVTTPSPADSLVHVGHSLIPRTVLTADLVCTRPAASARHRRSFGRTDTKPSVSCRFRPDPVPRLPARPRGR